MRKYTLTLIITMFALSSCSAELATSGTSDLTASTSIRTLLSKDLQVETEFYRNGTLDIHKNIIGGQRLMADALDKSTGHINVVKDSYVVTAPTQEDLTRNNNKYIIIRGSGEACLSAGGWHLEPQREGVFLITAGLANNDSDLINSGIKAIQWGLDRQASDGLFAAINQKGEYVATCDYAHQTAFFVEAAAHSYLLLNAAGRVTPEVSEWPEKIKKSAKWMISKKEFYANTKVPGNDQIATNSLRQSPWQEYMTNGSTYTHRAFLTASALGLTYRALQVAGKLQYDDDTLFLEPIRQMHEISISNVERNKGGYHKEKGGYDSSYQMVGLMYASKLIRFFPGKEMGYAYAPTTIPYSIKPAAQWIESRRVNCNQENVEPPKKTLEPQKYEEYFANLGNSISFSMVGNTRVTLDGAEQGISGASKNTIDLHRAVRAMKYVSIVLESNLVSNQDAEFNTNQAPIFEEYTNQVSMCYKSSL